MSTSPLPPLGVVGMVALVLGLLGWAVSGHWQAAAVGLALCLTCAVLDAGLRHR
ncbi:hypothetical protein JNUCC0626_19870 [Lentzea sp. JNUCC 0626]|uniref:hypothetical protein n=1 Tax=Lentzea sp. JNUCC 0626 TaxID=3367513 RepID=UPI0037478D0C